MGAIKFDRDWPEPTARLDMRQLASMVAQEDGDLVVRARDNDECVVFEPGIGTAIEQAIQSAERIAGVFLHYAEMLRIRTGDPIPLTHASAEATTRPVQVVGEPARRATGTRRG